MFGGEPSHLVDPIPVLEHVFQIDGTIKHLIEFLDVADAFQFRQFQKFLVQRFPIHPQVIGGKGVVKRNGGAVFHRLPNGILVQVALRIIAAEDLESPLAVGGAVDGRAGEAEIGGVGDGSHQVIAQVAARGAMGLIDQHENIVSQTYIGGPCRRTCGSWKRSAHDGRSAASSARCRLLSATTTLPIPTDSKLPNSCVSNSFRSTSISTVGFSNTGSSMSRLATVIIV